ncbi:hypothetical protein [Vibrio furnissii]|uniref:hypothetical protein n=1 Tax=Vibrio furnissii TaxID=29494 RepID=UPI001EECC84B|nr:hypothetical protein [Vibrio furnissii]MCG6268494.1 hypothetical protein [Vibrio furnissii]
MSDVKAELSRSFKILQGGWERESNLMLNEESWIGTWYSVLSKFDASCIHSVTNYVIGSFHRPPMLSEFYQLCIRHAKGECLEQPIASNCEVLAKDIISTLSAKLEAEESVDYLPDALLIASIILRARQMNEWRIPLTNGAVETDFVGRMRMFAHECKIWQKEADQGKGYWRQELGSRNADRDFADTPDKD